MENKTLEDFKNELVREKEHLWGTYDDFEHFKSMNSYIDVKDSEHKAKDRFHAYQLDLKDKEIEQLKKEIAELKQMYPPIETDWDYQGWLSARMPEFKTKESYRVWIDQCIHELVKIRLEQMASSDNQLTLGEIEEKIEELFDSNHKEFKGSNEAFLHFKEQLAEWMQLQEKRPVCLSFRKHL